MLQILRRREPNEQLPHIVRGKTIAHDEIQSMFLGKLAQSRAGRFGKLTVVVGPDHSQRGVRDFGFLKPNLVRSPQTKHNHVEANDEVLENPTNLGQESAQSSP
jgi:hypothetical protein